MSDYYSIKLLERDKSFLWSTALSLIVSIAAVAVSAVFFLDSKFVLQPIANVTITTPKDAPTGPHILTTSEFIAITKNNDEIKREFPAGTEIYSYATSLKKLCASGLEKADTNKIVIALSDYKQLVGIAKSEYDCKYATQLKPGEEILVTSDNPIRGVESKKVLITLKDLIQY